MAQRVGPRLRFLLWAPGIAALLVAFLPLGWMLPNLLRQSVGESLESSLDFLAPTIVEQEERDIASLQSWVADLGRSQRLRLTIIAEDGGVVADSSRDLAGMLAMDNHADRPEVLAAYANGQVGRVTRPSATTGLSYIYVVRILQTPSGGTWAVRLARPLQELSTLNTQLLWTLGLAAIGAALAAAGVLLWFRRSFLRPFAQLLEESENLAAGDTSYRVPDPPVEELAVISRSLNRLADRVEEQIGEKEAERHRLQEILAGVPLGVLVTGPDGTLIYANSTLLALFGARFADSEKVSKFLAVPEIRAALEEAAGGDDVVEVNHTLEERDLAVSARRIEALGGILLMIRDITEATRVERMRRDFVANLSHEIKTPLAVIRGAAETIEEASDDREAIEHFVPVIVKQIYRLEDLLKDLLTLSRLESPETALETQSVDLGEICERATELIEPVAERAQVAVEVTIGSVPPLDGDPKALERLVLNLLVNGVQYNSAGGTVRLRLDHTGNNIALEVEDDGCGIPEDELPRIFERFYRVDKGRGRREGGSGLGLAIVKHVAQFHGGSVEVRSYLDRGSVFRIVVPIGVPDATAETTVAP